MTYYTTRKSYVFMRLNLANVEEIGCSTVIYLFLFLFRWPFLLDAKWRHQSRGINSFGDFRPMYKGLGINGFTLFGNYMYGASRL